jgi:hypothetical protein
MEMSGQLHAPASLLPEKEPLVPIGQEAGWTPESRSGRGGEEKMSQFLRGLEPPIIQTVSQRYTTELSWGFINKSAMFYAVFTLH